MWPLCTIQIFERGQLKMLIPIAALATQWKFHGSSVGVAQDIPERL
jgi:hypothetical protein